MCARFECLVVVPLALMVSASAQAGPVDISDFPAEATVIGFDEFPHATPLSSEFATLGVLFESGEPSGSESGSTNPNDFLQPGESVSPFVLAINAVPSSSTPSLPNKVIGTKLGAGGGLLAYDAASIIITFLAPIPRIAGLHITDRDAKNNASFYGPAGLLDQQVLGPGTEEHTFLGFEDPNGISSIVVKTSVPDGGGSGGIGVDDVRFGNPVVELDSEGIPMLSEWALILFATILVGTSIWMIQRRLRLRT